MRIIFAGTPANAAHTLEALVAAGLNVVGVLTREDASVGRKKVLSPSPVAAVAGRYGIETKKANMIAEEVSSWIKGLEPDLGVIVAYGSILKQPSLKAPILGWINLHYSLLPKFPGAAPIQHAILSGETTTGVTVFQLDEGIDTGPILSQAEIEIGETQTSGQLLETLTVLGSDLLVDTLKNLQTRIASKSTQVLPTGMPVAGKILRPNARLGFLLPALEVHNFVRAMNPEPVAWFEYEGLQVRVLQTSLSDVTSLGAGECSMVGKELTAGCAKGSVNLLLVQPAGKTQMSGADWFRGLRQESISIL